jgi:hypothetical protein
MTEEKKDVNPQDSYRNKIESLLSKISKGEASPEPVPQPKVEEKTPEPTTYEKMKAMGGIKVGLEKLFKLDESAFDVPHYVTNEEESEQMVATHLFRVLPPSNHPDADEYWKRVSPYLKRIGKIVPHVGEGAGCLDMSVVSLKGEEEVLRIQLVRDESKGEKPTLTFQFVHNDDITIEDVLKFIGRVGLVCPDRLAAQQLPGLIVLDVVENRK